MKKKILYFTVEKELQSIDGFEETTGNKTITVYDIVNNEPKEVMTIEAENSDNSVEMIENDLENNPHSFGDVEFEFVLL